MNSLRMCSQKKIFIKEGFVNEDRLSSASIMKKINNYIERKIIAINDKNLSIPEAIKQRKFTVYKIPIYFIEPKNPCSWTPLSFLKSRVDNDGNVVQIDPLEEIVRKMSPYDAFKIIIKERIEPIVSLKFEFVNNPENAVVKIGFERDKGTWSLVGLDHFFSTEKVTLNMSWLDVGTILHEIGHILGLNHEHQNPVGRKIEWDEEKVYEWSKLTNGWDRETTYENIIKTYDVNNIKAINFDPKSIMLYFFPAELTKNKKGSNQNFIPSPADFRFFKELLPGKTIDTDIFWNSIYTRQIYYKSSFIKIIAIAILILTLFIFIYWMNTKHDIYDEIDSDIISLPPIYPPQYEITKSDPAIILVDNPPSYRYEPKPSYRYDPKPARINNYENVIEIRNKLRVPFYEKIKQKIKTPIKLLPQNTAYPRPLLPELKEKDVLGLNLFSDEINSKINNYNIHPKPAL